MRPGGVLLAAALSAAAAVAARAAPPTTQPAGTLSTVAPAGALSIVAPAGAVSTVPPAGASSCSGCHGAAMPLVGRDARETAGALLAFRSGARDSTVMGRIAKGFTPGELDLIATWWEGRR